jgi:hypothetical protein
MGTNSTGRRIGPMKNNHMKKVFNCSMWFSIMSFFSLVSSPLRGGLRWGHQFSLLYFDLTLTLSYEERELFFWLPK